MKNLLFALALLMAVTGCQYKQASTSPQQKKEAPAPSIEPEVASPEMGGESSPPPPPPPAPVVEAPTHSTGSIGTAKPSLIAPSRLDKAPQQPSSDVALATEGSAPSTAAAPAVAGAMAKNTVPAPASLLQSERPNHAAWNSLLQQYVSNSGQVNYQSWRANTAALEAYLSDLANHIPQGDWTKSEKMAYWMNAYNAFTIKLILDNPTPSIRDLHGGKPWDLKWIKLGSETYSLNQIENSILRPRFKDARIHFAINCAAKSCPPLHNQAFTAENTERLLEQLTQNFVRNASFNTFTPEQAQVSRIFDWYADDFGDLKAFLNRYLTQPLNANTNLTFKEYNWALNGR